MTVVEVKNKLPLKDGYVYMGLFENYILPEDFVARFSGASLTYTSLMGHVNATAGWKMQFDAWKAEGVI